jgi:hypothetical protein
MAVDTAKVGTAPFDSAFTNAGDDVDLSWRLRDAEMTLAYAPGAIVLHERRRTIRAYLEQQRGYGRAEGLLYRKYPNREDRAYGESRWFAHWFGAGSRIYYGAFGRGLFQTIYPRSRLPLAAQVPLTWQWITLATFITMAGVLYRNFAILGVAGLLVTLACAIAGATGSPGQLHGFISKLVLVGLWVLGPVLRGWERDREKWSFTPDVSGAAAFSATRLSGTIPLRWEPPQSIQADSAWPDDQDEMIEVLHLALIRRGLAVAKGSSYDSFDLRIIVAPYVRIAVLFLRSSDALALRWRTGMAGWRIAASLTALIAMLLVGGLSPATASAISGLVAAAVAQLALRRARQVPAVLDAAAAELSARGKITSPARKERPSTSVRLGEGG